MRADGPTSSRGHNRYRRNRRILVGRCNTSGHERLLNGHSIDLVFRMSGHWYWRCEAAPSKVLLRVGHCAGKFMDSTAGINHEADEYVDIEYKPH